MIYELGITYGHWYFQVRCTHGTLIPTTSTSGIGIWDLDIQPPVAHHQTPVSSKISRFLDFLDFPDSVYFAQNMYRDWTDRELLLRYPAPSGTIRHHPALSSIIQHHPPHAPCPMPHAQELNDKRQKTIEIDDRQTTNDTEDRGQSTEDEGSDLSCLLGTWVPIVFPLETTTSPNPNHNHNHTEVCTAVTVQYVPTCCLFLMSTIDC